MHFLHKKAPESKDLESISRLNFTVNYGKILTMKQAKIQAFIPWTLLILCSVCYVSLIFNQNVWMDEAFTATLIRTDMAGVISRSMKDTLPPLYNILLKLMTDLFGYSVPVMKITSVIPMIATLFLGATVVRRRHGLFAGCLFMLSLTAMPLMLYYGVEIRMYSIGFFFSTASGIYAFEVLLDSNRKNWILFTLFSVLAGYSHHFAFVCVGVIYFFLLLYYITKQRQNIRRWFLCLLATLILYLPCLLITLKQLKRVSGYFSMPEITPRLFVQYMLYPYTTGITVLSLLLLLSVICLFVRRIVLFVRKGKQNSVPDASDAEDVADTESARHMYALLCVLPYYLILLFGTVLSKIMTANIFVDRYLFFSCGLIWLFFSIEISSLPEAAIKGIRIPVRALAVIFILLIFAATFHAEWELEYGQDPSDMIAYLDSHVSSGDGLITCADSEALYWCLPFYAPALHPYDTTDHGLGALNDNTISRLWIAVDEAASLPELRDANGDMREPVYDGTFDFDRYRFSLYHTP